MRKDTAVDWLITQIRNQAQNGTLDALVIAELRKQANAMEREQMIDFVVNIKMDLSIDEDGEPIVKYNPTEHYNETYG